MTAWQVAAFLGCVALAAAAQSITGFALALIVVGLAGLLDLAPLRDVVNVANVLSLVAAAITLRGRLHHLDRRLMRPTAQGSIVGVALGVFLLAWLSANVVVVLRLLLGLTIAGCALVVLLRTRPLPQLSSSPSFQGFGLLSGLLGGLFSASGPPLVYQFYRQPVALESIRESLVASLAIGSVLRLVLVVASGQFTLDALVLCALGTPVALGVGTWMRRHPPAWPRARVLRLVCVLLLLTGAGLAGPAVQALATYHLRA
jgi:uncharacterized protein